MFRCILYVLHLYDTLLVCFLYLLLGHKAMPLHVLQHTDGNVSGFRVKTDVESGA